MFHIVLVEPEIPQNAGNIARTAVLTVLPAVVMATLGTVVLVRRKFRH